VRYYYECQCVRRTGFQSSKSSSVPAAIITILSFRGVNAKSLLPHSLQNFRVNGCPESVLVSAWDFRVSSPCVIEKPLTPGSARRSIDLAVAQLNTSFGTIDAASNADPVIRWQLRQWQTVLWIGLDALPWSRYLILPQRQAPVLLSLGSLMVLDGIANVFQFSR